MLLAFAEVHGICNRSDRAKGPHFGHRDIPISQFAVKRRDHVLSSIVSVEKLVVHAIFLYHDTNQVEKMRQLQEFFVFVQAITHRLTRLVVFGGAGKLIVRLIGGILRF
jgi:putative NADH-flavin reductase